MEFRRMLLGLDRILTRDEVKSMIFMSKNDIPARLRVNLTCLEFFEKLEEREKLSEDNVTHLQFLLETCCNKRTDVLNVVEQYVTQKRRAASNDHQVEKQTNRVVVDNTFLHLFEYLAEELGKDYCKFFRFLGVQDSALDRLRQEHPQNIKEVIERALENWQGSQPSPHDPVQSILTALRQIKRNDLANQVSVKVNFCQGERHVPQSNMDLDQKGARRQQVATVTQGVQKLVLSDGNNSVKN